MDLVKATVGSLAVAGARRLGVVVAAFLVAKGIPDEIANRLVMAAAVFGGVGFDALVAWYYYSRGAR